MQSQIPFICKKLYESGLIAGCEGNVSEKKGGQIFITPSGVNKSELKAEDLCIIDSKGQNIKGRASSEKHMHLSIYEFQKKAKAVIHAHPPAAIALSLARPDWKVLPPAMPEIILNLGDVPFAPYESPGSKKLGLSLKPFIEKSQAVILSHHGAVVWAESLNAARSLMEQLEQACKILCLSESMGGAAFLPEKEISRLKRLRS